MKQIARSTAPTPRALGFRMPAEWEPHETTWIAWPHNRDDWPGRFAPIPWVYGEIVRKIAAGEIVRILVNSAAHQARAVSVLQRCGVDLGRVEFFRFPTNRGWTRDFGPMFVRQDGRRPAKGFLRNNEDDRENKGRVAIVRFRFNGWADADNPNHYSNDCDVHARFETWFINRQIDCYSRYFRIKFGQGLFEPEFQYNLVRSFAAQRGELAERFVVAVRRFPAESLE